MSNMKTVAGLVRYVVRHPSELGTLPRWFPERRLSPMAARRPWWPYAATEWVEANLPSQARAFEYGGGGSTLWLTDHGARVTVAEHDPGWAGELEAAGLSVIYRPAEPTGTVRSAVAPGFFDAYTAAIDPVPDGCLDLVIVDGRARVECARHAMPKVKPGGLLLLDDTDRARYQPAVEALASWQRYVFRGLKPGDVWPAQTSVWKRPVTSA